MTPGQTPGQDAPPRVPTDAYALLGHGAADTELSGAEQRAERQPRLAQPLPSDVVQAAQELGALEVSAHARAHTQTIVSSALARVCV